MSLKLNSSGGGSVTLLEPTTASNRTLNLPNVDGTVITTADSGTVSSTMIAAAAVTPAKLSQPLTLATAQATTSGTAIDFTGIPSWVRRITVILNGVSTNGTSNPLLQIGAGSVTTSGYVAASGLIQSGAASTASYTSGFGITAGNASNVFSGSFVVMTVGSNVWIASYAVAVTQGASAFAASGGGSVTLGGTLDRIRLTTVNGTDAFDAGSVNIMYEG